MFRTILKRARRSAVVMAAIPALAFAQTGRISGTVTDGSKGPVAGAQILVTAASLSAESRADGKFTVTGVPAGTYSVTVYRLGFKARTMTGVTVTAGQSASLPVSLEAAVVQLGGVTVSASRRVEKVTDAPAAVTTIDAKALEGTVGNSFAPALKGVPGLDFIQVGVTASAVNARGFNSSFNTRMLQTEDGRIATLPEAGLPAGTLTTIPKVDIASVEVLTGPGSALYGPDASNGVITLSTKDPKAFPGYTLEVSGGTRNFFDAQGRYAGVTSNGKWGYKINGEYQTANDYTYVPSYPNPLSTAAAPLPPVLEKGTDFNTNVVRGNGMLAYYFENGGRLSVDAGASASYGIGQTNLGRNQLVNYGYKHLQLKYTGARWFAQVYENSSTGGGTFQLNGYTTNSISHPTISSDSAKALSSFPGEGRIMAAELQNNFSFGSLAETGTKAFDDTHMIWGVQYRRDRVSSYMDWLTDRQTGKAILVEQKGAYLQLETPWTDMVRTVLSARYDQPDRYGSQFSPKAAILFSPVADQTFRITYGKAFKSPTILMTDFFFPNFAPFIGVFGNTTGYDVKNAAGTILTSYNAIKPETNNTWEVGYKGEISNKLFVDITAYQTKYQDFQSPLSVIANPFAGTFAYNHVTGKVVTDPAGGPQVVLIYYNLGEATIGGIDAGLKYYFSDNVSASGNIGLLKVDTIKTTNAEATAINSTSAKVNAGMDFANIMPSTNAGFSMRYVNRYSFLSGVNVGIVPSFGTLDFSASYQIPKTNTRITLQAQNVFACTGGTSTPPATGIASGVKATYTVKQSCGFGQTHQEMLNMPAIGPLVFLGVRWDGR
jgi:outer membrane receptor for ferrienterochelin and colicins